MRSAQAGAEGNRNVDLILYYSGDNALNRPFRCWAMLNVFNTGLSVLINPLIKP